MGIARALLLGSGAALAGLLLRRHVKAPRISTPPDTCSSSGDTETAVYVGVPPEMSQLSAGARQSRVRTALEKRCARQGGRGRGRGGGQAGCLHVSACRHIDLYSLPALSAPCFYPCRSSRKPCAARFLPAGA